MKTKSFYFLMVMLTALSCSKEDNSGPEGMDFKNEMRKFVIGISQYARSQSAGFVIIPQNGQELTTSDGTSDGSIDTAYMNAIDGQGREDLFYGYENDDLPTATGTRNYLIGFLDRIKQYGKTVLVTDYCSTQSKMTDSYVQNGIKGYVSFAADHRELNNLPIFPPVINNQNSNNITYLSDARNFLYLIDPADFTKSRFIDVVNGTDYDVIIMDMFINDEPFSAAEIESLKHKKDGGTRLIICYMSIGEAEDYRYYWQEGWSGEGPSWLGGENPDWPGNYQVKYWDKNWQDIIFGNDMSYVKKILNAHFDGIYLDLVDAFENWQ